jgi:hypothetical protein
MSSALDNAFDRLFELVGGLIKSSLFVECLQAHGQSALENGKFYWDLTPDTGFIVIDIEDRRIYMVNKKTDPLNDTSLRSESELGDQLFVLIQFVSIYEFAEKVAEIAELAAFASLLEALIKLVEAEIKAEEGK